MRSALYRLSYRAAEYDRRPMTGDGRQSAVVPPEPAAGIELATSRLAIERSAF